MIKSSIKYHQNLKILCESKKVKSILTLYNKNGYNILLMLLLLFLSSCDSIPNKPDPSLNLNGRIAFILCEGLKGQNNSDLCLFDIDKYISYVDYFNSLNGFNIGDTGNDIITKNDTAYVVMNGNGTIEVISLKSLKHIRTIKLPEGASPRRLIIVNDSMLAVTDLYKDLVYIFNSNMLTTSFQTIKVGPAPEFISKIENNNNIYLFVANSGLGDYEQTKPNAGKISVINISTMAVEKNVYIGPNLIELITYRDMIICSYRNLPSLKDSLGGIVILDNNFNELRRIRCLNNSITMDTSTNILYYLNNNGLNSLNIDDSSSPKLVWNNKNKADILYSLAINYSDRSIWIGNAKNNQVKAEVIILDKDSYQLMTSFQTGLNPNKIIFK